MSERDNLGLSHRCHYWSTKEKVNHDINLDEARWGNWKDQAGHQNHQQRRKGPQAQAGSTHRIRVLQPSMSEPEGPGGGSGSLTDQHLDDHRAYPPICKIRTSPACSPCLRGEYNSGWMWKAQGRTSLHRWNHCPYLASPAQFTEAPLELIFQKPQPPMAPLCWSSWQPEKGQSLEACSEIQGCLWHNCGSRKEHSKVKHWKHELQWSGKRTWSKVNKEL